MQLSTRVVDSSRCIERIINPPQHWVKIKRRVKIEDNKKSISGSQGVRSGSTNASDECVPIGRQSDREPKLFGLTTCSGASDDTTNIRPGQGPSSCISPRGNMQQSKESRSGACL
jgi:hypothetical protein